MQRFQSISQQSMSPHRNPERLASSPLADPGMFSLNCLYAAACLPEGEKLYILGGGRQPGHSDAIPPDEGVKDARWMYTIPESALR